MYRRPKFLEKLLEIRQEMAMSTNYDVNLFTELIRTGELSEPLLPALMPSADDIYTGAEERTLRRRRTLVEK